MGIDDRKNVNVATMQNIFLENRNKLTVTGVIDVLSFDDEIIITETELGMLTVKGDNLKINKLSIDTSEVVVDGEINSLNYSMGNVNKKNESFLGKLFK